MIYYSLSSSSSKPDVPNELTLKSGDANVEMTWTVRNVTDDNDVCVNIQQGDDSGFGEREHRHPQRKQHLEWILWARFPQVKAWGYREAEEGLSSENVVRKDSRKLKDDKVSVEPDSSRRFPGLQPS